MEETLKTIFSLFVILFVGLAMAFLQPAYATDIVDQPVLSPNGIFETIDQNTSVELNYVPTAMVISANMLSHPNSYIIDNHSDETTTGLMSLANFREVETVLKFPYLIQIGVENTNELG
jgi:hypothetical protein